MGYDLIIIGGGCAGLAGAMYAGRMQLKTLVLMGELPGGTITTTDVVENYPGFVRLTGQELADKLLAHAKEYGKFVAFRQERATGITKGADGFRVATEEGAYQGKTILYATGTKHRSLGVPGEREFWAKGVHNCALCDGAFYKNKVLALVGGGDSAAKEALLLAQWATKVYVLARSKFRPEPINGERVAANKKLSVHTGVEVKGIRGNAKVRSVLLSAPVNGSTELAVDGVFLEIGADPVTELAKELGVALNQKGEIIIDRDAATNVPGFYAAGDCVDTRFKQAITGAAEAVLGVYAAYTFINQQAVKPRG